MAQTRATEWSSRTLGTIAALRGTTPNVIKEYFNILNGRKREPDPTPREFRHAFLLLHKDMNLKVKEAGDLSREGRHFDSALRFSDAIEMAEKLAHLPSEIRQLRLNAAREYTKEADAQRRAGKTATAIALLDLALIQLEEYVLLLRK